MIDLDWCEPGGSRGYVTTKPLVWRIGRKDSSWLVTVPIGFEFESSVPTLKYKWRWLQCLLGWFQPFHWWLSPDDPLFLKPAAIHDCLLESGHRYWFSDSQWFEVALSNHAPLRKSVPAYLGMRLRRFWQWAFGSSNGQ